MTARFGPGGNSLEFSREGYKSTIQAPQFLSEKGLNAYEIECGRGVNMKEETAKKLKTEAQKYGIVLSVHAPYYISLGSPEEEKRINSVKYIVDSARLAHWAGAKNIVVHPGGLNKMTREQSAELAMQTLRIALDTLEREGLSDVILCPETMGKGNQLGNLEEIIAFCRMDERLLPCVDFGHLNARAGGQLKSKKDYAAVLDAIENALGYDRMANMHVHFSKIEYSGGGEVRHLTFEDKTFGPSFEPLMELAAVRMQSPTFICESAGTQSEDALAMKQYYNNSLKGDLE